MTQFHELPSVLTVDELAKLLRMNRKTAYEAIARNEIPGVKRIGRQFRISRDAVLDWLADGSSAGDVLSDGGAAVTRVTGLRRRAVVRSGLQDHAAPGGH